MKTDTSNTSTRERCGQNAGRYPSHVTNTLCCTSLGFYRLAPQSPFRKKVSVEFGSVCAGPN